MRLFSKSLPNQHATPLLQPVIQPEEYILLMAYNLPLQLINKVDVSTERKMYVL